MLLQSLLIKKILHPLSVLSGKLSQRTRDFLFLAALTVLFLENFLYSSQILPYRYLISFAVGCFSLGVMLFCLLPERMEAVSFRPLPLILLYAFALSVLFAGLTVSGNYLPEVILLMIVYPIFYIVCGNADRAHVFRLFIRGIEISFYFFAVISAILFPAVSIHYGGLFSNVNNAAFYLALACLAFTADLFYEPGHSPASFVRAGFGGMAASLLFYTNSRTGMLAYLIALVLLAAFYMIPRRFRVGKVFWLRLLVFVLILAACVAVILTVFQFVNTAAKNTVDFFEGLFSDSAPADDNPADSVEVLDLGSFFECAAAKVQTDGKDFEALSTHRSVIWGNYVRALSFKGHSEPIPYTVDYGYMIMTSHTSHMTVLQAAYDYGVHSGVLLLLFHLLSGIYALIYAARRSRDIYSAFPLMVTAAFGAVSLLASLTASFNYTLLMFYYLVQFPLMLRPQGEKRD